MSVGSEESVIGGIDLCVGARVLWTEMCASPTIKAFSYRVTHYARLVAWFLPRTSCFAATYMVTDVSSFGRLEI